MTLQIIAVSCNCRLLLCRLPDIHLGRITCGTLLVISRKSCILLPQWLSLIDVVLSLFRALSIKLLLPLLHGLAEDFRRDHATKGRVSHSEEVAHR